MSTTDANLSSRRRKIAGAALVAVLAAVLIAVVVVRGGGEKVINAGGDTLVLVGKKTDVGRTALGRGTLADVGGCLGWAGENGEPGTVVVWPHGTNVETPDPLRVKIKGTFYELGDTVEVGGGFADGLDPSSTLYQQAPQKCRDAKVWFAS
ncbi:hypothetical protein [Aeromicrobium wangtongii]|uniref:Uncharacterized protein n=1 Tax=Aeromicrobium wangtongii TaxID=2969247 RepID=A0ABY5MD30_9ACTN|nr:hypothetical protein [Aeromicrobium wangtongii]MCD9197340.1 hypothetical protein [Aeromicrobium wangtongii]UUP14834.1 hypothetical protein NQV15_05850 [Aeromicrobium wangtongii]